MISEILRQLQTVPEYFIALKAALAILACGVPIYAGLWYFLHERHLKAHWGFTINFVGVFVLLAGLAFFLSSPLAGHIHPALVTAYLFVTSVVAALSIVSLIDLFLLQHYLSGVKKVYISPPLRTVIKLSIFCLAILPIFRYVLHFNPLTLVAIPTVLTAGIALALQDTLKTFIAGVALGKIIRLGEWISFQDKEGEVIDINWARTVLRTMDGNYIFIPNSQLQTNTFLNYMTANPSTRHVLKVGAAYDAPPARVKQIMAECARNVPGVSASPEPRAVVMDYADSSVVYGLYYWLQDFSRRLDVRDDVATRVWYAFRREGIEIPYPSRTLYLKRSTEASKEKTENVERALREWALAEAFYPEELHELTRFTHSRSYASGETIVKEGDPGQTLYVVASGSVDIVKMDRPNDPLASLAAGEIFGEMSLLTGEPRAATVRAKGSVEVLEIEKAGLQAVLARRPDLSNQLAELVVKRQAMLAAHAGPGSAQPEHSSQAPSLAGKIRKFFGL